MANSPSPLALLQANAHLTPDQIAAKLEPKRWYKFGDLTDAQMEILGGKRVVYFQLDSQGRIESRDTRGEWRFWGHRSHADGEYFRTALRNYYGILAEDYVDGDRPPSCTER